MAFIHRILTFAALFLVVGAAAAAGDLPLYLLAGLHAAQESSPIERAEQNIVLQWKKDPRLKYDRLSYRGTLKECQAGSFRVKQVLTLRGVWIPIRDLPPETLVFRGERAGFRPGKTKGGAGYFFCNPETGELTAFLLMK